MNPRQNNKNKAAISFMEYALILGLVSAVIIGMNTYIKRGLQGRIKEMSDYFISNRQVVELNPTTSASDTVINTEVNREGYLGGGSKLALLETKNVSSSSSVEDDQSSYYSSFIPSGSGDVDPDDRPDDDDFIDPDQIEECGEYCEMDFDEFESDWENMVNIENLERERDRLIRVAEGLETRAPELENMATYMRDQANRIRCPRRRRRRCNNAKRELRWRADILDAQALAMRAGAGSLRVEVWFIQEKIYTLQDSDYVSDPAQIAAQINQLEAQAASLEARAVYLAVEAAKCRNRGLGDVCDSLQEQVDDMVSQATRIRERANELRGQGG